MRLFELKAAPASEAKGAGRERVPDRWWEKVAAMVRVSPRGKTPFPFKAGAGWRRPSTTSAPKRITAVEVFAPAEGGRSFGGLDTIDRYRFEPAAGTLDDFKALVQAAHARDMAVISFDNLGYSSIEAVEFLKAAHDVREGRASREASFFLWSDSKDAPPPSKKADRVFFVRPTHLPGGGPGGLYESSKQVLGVERARPEALLDEVGGRGPAGQEGAPAPVRLGEPGLPGGGGEDRPLLDGHGDRRHGDRCRQLVHRLHVGAHSSPRDRRHRGLRQRVRPARGRGRLPRGPGRLDHRGGGWNSVQDYGLGIWWEKGTNVIANAIESGDPRPLEGALRAYHDRVVEAGGGLYFQPTPFDDEARSRLAFATLATLGTLVQLDYRPNRPLGAEERWLLETKAAHPALQQLSRRRRIPTASDDKYYAFLRTAADGAERIAPQSTLRLPLAAFGYRLLAVTR